MHERRACWALAGAAAALALAGVLAACTAASGGSTGGDELPPEKRQRATEAAALYTAGAQVSPAAKDRNPVRPTPRPFAAPTGIIAHRPNSFMGHEFETVFQWVRDGRFIQVYSGAERDDPTRGAVLVVSSSTENGTGSGETYFSPEKTGSLRIVAGDVKVLYLTSAGGASYAFDVATGAYTVVDAVPTETPSVAPPTPAAATPVSAAP